MAFSILEFDKVTPEFYAISVCDRDGCVCQSSIYNWLLFGKLPIDEVVEAGYTTKVVGNTMKNRYLRQVTIEPIPVTTITATLAVGGTLVYDIEGASKSVSSTPSIATATTTDTITTITGVAAGTTVVTITDIHSDTIATITVTVA